MYNEEGSICAGEDVIWKCRPIGQSEPRDMENPNSTLQLSRPMLCSRYGGSRLNRPDWIWATHVLNLNTTTTTLPNIGAMSSAEYNTLWLQAYGVQQVGREWLSFSGEAASLRRKVAGNLILPTFPSDFPKMWTLIIWQENLCICLSSQEKVEFCGAGMKWSV